MRLIEFSEHQYLFCDTYAIKLLHDTPQKQSACHHGNIDCDYALMTHTNKYSNDSHSTLNIRSRMFKNSCFSKYLNFDIQRLRFSQIFELESSKIVAI